MKTIADVMSGNPRTLSAEDSILDAARVLRDDDIGDVLITRDGEVAGIVTDRDIIIPASPKASLLKRRRSGTWPPRR